MGFRRSCRHGVNYMQRRMTEFFALSSSLMIFSRNPVLSAPLKVSWYSVDNTVQRTPNEPGRLRYNGTGTGMAQSGTGRGSWSQLLCLPGTGGPCWNTGVPHGYRMQLIPYDNHAPLSYQGAVLPGLPSPSAPSPTPSTQHDIRMDLINVTSVNISGVNISNNKK
ncbi:hypothetical protein RvY_18503 [Ramazzottius varieornatus]|uniref:Uncharacterized protein n=1 Tax=Ramazzottius varieornatus TaxID=947166 RepID=A0A1D1W5Z9_RAMVA|nr:hypothetical protein RvY_18503 [Ramazzottius varieornatus]